LLIEVVGVTGSLSRALTVKSAKEFAPADDLLLFSSITMNTRLRKKIFTCESVPVLADLIDVPWIYADQIEVHEHFGLTLMLSELTLNR
jgi:hypothetical protein